MTTHPGEEHLAKISNPCRCESLTMGGLHGSLVRSYRFRPPTPGRCCFGHTASAVGGEGRRLLRLALGSGLKDQVDECAGLERQELATGIKQIQVEFLQGEFREHRPQHIDERGIVQQSGRAIVPNPCRPRR